MKKRNNYRKDTVEALIGIAVCISFIVSISYVAISIKTCQKKQEGLILEYERVLAQYESMQKENDQTAMYEGEANTLQLWTNIQNLNSMSFEEAEKCGLEKEYVDAQVANKVYDLAYEMKQKTTYKSKRDAVRKFEKEITNFESSIKKKYIWFSSKSIIDAKEYAKYLIKIFR